MDSGETYIIHHILPNNTNWQLMRKYQPIYEQQLLYNQSSMHYPKSISHLTQQVGTSKNGMPIQEQKPFPLVNQAQNENLRRDTQPSGNNCTSLKQNDPGYNQKRILFKQHFRALLEESLSRNSSEKLYSTSEILNIFDNLEEKEEAPDQVIEVEQNESYSITDYSSQSQCNVDDQEEEKKIEIQKVQKIENPFKISKVMSHQKKKAVQSSEPGMIPKKRKRQRLTRKQQVLLEEELLKNTNVKWDSEKQIELQQRLAQVGTFMVPRQIYKWWYEKAKKHNPDIVQRPPKGNEIRIRTHGS